MLRTPTFLCNRIEQVPCHVTVHGYPHTSQLIKLETYTLNLCTAVMVLQDSIVPVERVVPPLKYCTKEELHSLAEQPMIPLNVEGDRQYLISLRHGLLVDKQRLFQILEGTFGTDSDRYVYMVDFDSQHNAHT